MYSKQSLSALKEVLSSALVSEKALERERFLCPWGEPIPAGSVVELAGMPGSGKTELIIQFLKKNKALKVAWIEEEFTFYPYFWEQSGLDLKNVCFIEAGNHWAWCARQALNSLIFHCVVLGGGSRNSIDLRRLQLLAEKSKAIIFLLSDELTRTASWPIQSQFSVQRVFDGSISVASQKQRKEIFQ